MKASTREDILQKYLKLQNGSDIRGVALEGVPGEDVNLDINTSYFIGRAFARWLRNKYCGYNTSSNNDAYDCCNSANSNECFEFTISVGQDPRLSGFVLADTFIEGVLLEGVNVYNCGLASTPAMFMSTIFDSFDCDGAVMITASHLPFNRNGFKFFSKEGGLDKGDIKEILSIAAAIEEDFATPVDSRHGAVSGDAKSGDLWCIPSREGTMMKGELMDRYCRHLCELICDGIGVADNSLPLEGLKIVVDAGNGAGGFYADKVLQPLGADVVGCYLEPDGNFPNHIPNPENKEAMASICSAVKEHNADLGIIFDTDVDRSAAVDENGHEIARNGIVALAAALVGEKHPGTTVVTDSITSDQLAVFLESDLGMKHLRFKRGYKNVINKAIELNDAGEECYLAIETSGHAAIKDNHFLDDGAYLATLIVIKTAQLAAEGKKISSMISGLEEPADAIEVRMKLTGDDFAAVGDRILAELEEWIRGNSDCSSSCSDSTGSGNNSAGSNNCADSSLTIDGSSYFQLVEPNYEGVRAKFSNTTAGSNASPEVTGWFLLRKSLHDPIMPLNIESNQVGGCAVIAEKLRDFLARYEELDISSL